MTTLANRQADEGGRFRVVVAFLIERDDDQVLLLSVAATKITLPVNGRSAADE